MMVSARKVKARLDKNKLAELKKKNVDKQEEMGISADEARQFSDDLVKSAISGFEKELKKSSPAMKMLAANLSGMIQEFFIGFKQGVDAELNTFVKDTGKAVTKATGAVVDSAEKIPEILKEPIEDLKQEQQEAKKEKEKITEEQKTEMIISDVLKRPTEAQGAAKTVLGKKGGVKDWLTRVGLGSIGMEETAEKIVAQRQQKEAFIQTESKLRAKEFEGKDPKEVRAILEENFKVISEATEKLREVEKEISAYKELGYSEEQAKQLGVGLEKQALTEKLVAADPSRLGMYKETQTTAKEKIQDRNQTTTDMKDVSVKETLEKKENSSVLEETILEQQKQDEEAAKKQDQQTTLLSEIRDILKEQKGGGTVAPAQGDGGGFTLPNLPSVGSIVKGAGSLARGAGNLLKGGLRLANTPLGGIAKFAAPLAAGMTVGGGVMDLAEGKKVEELGQVVPEGWDKLNPFSWAMRGGMYAGEKLNKGYSAVSEKLGGSGSLGSDIFEGVQKVKGFFTGKPTVEDAPKQKFTGTVQQKTPSAVPVSAPVTTAEMAAAETEQAPLQTTAVSDVQGSISEPQPLELTKTDTGEFIPVPLESAPAVMNMASDESFNAGDTQSNRRPSRTRSQRSPINDGGIIAAQTRKVTRKIDSAVGRATRNLPGFARAEIQSRTEKLGNIIKNPMGSFSKIGAESVLPNFDSKTRSLSTAVTEEQPANSMLEAAKEMGKNIVVQAPAPVVIPQGAGGGQQVVSQPFTNNIRNNEPSISDYLRSRYAY